MSRPLPPFPTAVVGSLPRPQYVKDLHQSAAPQDAAWRRHMDDAVRFAIGMQEQAGIDIISDGEWRRETYVDVVADLMTGFEWVKRDTFVSHQVITGTMRPKRPGAIADEAKFLRDNTDRHVKVCLPSPYLIGQRMWMPEHSRSAYPTREEFCEALVPVLRQELLAIREVGVDVIQLDEPHLCVLVDPQIRAQFADPQGEMDRAVGWINRIVEGVSGVSLAVHLCRRNWGRRGWGAEGGYEPILAHLQRLQVGQLLLEYSIPVAGDMAVLRQLPAGVKVGLGCVDVRFAEVETPEQIVGRVRKAMEHVPAERLSLNPDCGFAPGKNHDTPLEEAYAKLKSLSAAARMLREK